MTAVEWLLKQIDLHYNGENELYYSEFIEQAKEMEKQQIMDAFWNGDNSDCTSEQNSKEFAEKYYNETYGSKGSDEHIVDTNEMISIGDKIRYQKLETLAKLLAKSWFYGNWKWESPNERVQQMLMQELGYYPFKDEDEMIYHTKVDENLYKQAANEIKGWSELPKDISISSQTEISDEEIEDIACKRLVFDEISWIKGAKWYREQLKKKQ